MIIPLPKQKHAVRSPGERHRAFAGIFIRKERWGLSLPAKFIILAGMILLAGVGTRFMHQFLAITSRTNGEILVVEAWIPRYSLEQSVAVYKKGEYRKMLVSGCSRPDDLGVRSFSPAEAAATVLERFGMNPGSLTAVPCQMESKDRTYSTAMAVKAWMSENATSVKSIDVVTLGPHARRSRLLFQKAFGSKVKVGVIAIADRSYDGARWWQTSEGVREVIGEGIAYIYARIFFHPSRPDHGAAGRNQNFKNPQIVQGVTLRESANSTLAGDSP